MQPHQPIYYYQKLCCIWAHSATIKRVLIMGIS
jgi:hypothetical protein